MLLIKKTETVKLAKPAPKILKLSTAVQGYVYISTTDGCVTEKLIHIGYNGQSLWEKDYVDSVDTFGMFNEREVIVLNPKDKVIEVVDLHTHTVSSYPHEFVYDSTAYMEIYVFNDSKIFSVVQRGSFPDHRLFITYFTYQSHQVKEIVSYKSQQQEWSSDDSFDKVNNHSKFAWWKPKYDQAIDFYTFDLKDNNGGNLRNIKVGINVLGENYKMNTFALEIANLWETSPDVYMLVCNTNRPTGRQVQQKTNSNYILDAGKEIIREVKFAFPKLSNQLIECFNLGQISAFHTFNFEKGESLLSPVYYVNNERQEIIAKEKWIASSKTNFYVPGFDTSSVIQAKHNESEVQQIEVTSKRLMTPQEMYLHFLLHIYQDFDDNLLEDAINLLTQ